MKQLLSLLLFLLSTIFSYSQSSFRVKVIDEENGNPIPKAIVFIEEIPIPDKETDLSGFVFYQSIPEDRKVRIHIRKSGFLPKQIEVVANKDIGSDNNILVYLEKEDVTPQKIIWGEVTYEDGSDARNILVEINIAGKGVKTRTDESGNYRIKINSSEFIGLQEFRIEVSDENCGKIRESVQLTVNDIINKDIILICQNEENPLVNTDAFFPIETTAGDIIVKIMSIKFNRGEIEIDLKLFNNSNSSMDIGVFNGNQERNSSKINIDGDIYYSSQSRVAGNTISVAGNAKELISDNSWVNASVLFKGIPDMNTIPFLQIGTYYYDNGYKFFPIVFRQIPVLK